MYEARDDIILDLFALCSEVIDESVTGGGITINVKCV
jgi:hypothetical protein